VWAIGPDRVSLDPSGTLGAVMITVNTMLYAAYLVLSKDLLRRYPPLTVIGYVFGFGTLITLPFGIAALESAELTRLSATATLALVYIVLLPSLTVYFLSVWALQRTASSQVAMWVYIQPVLTAFAAPALLGERLTTRAVVSAGVIFAGMGLAIWSHQAGERRVTTVAAPEEGY
jgi:drug/metabolite transporter (DMT)-like permease